MSVLAMRIEAKISHRPAGWRLPRSSVLARHYGVPVAVLDDALADLLARQQISYLGPGQFCRADCTTGQHHRGRSRGLCIRIEPVGGQISCQSRQDTYGPLRDQLSLALALTPGTQALTIRTSWTVGAAPAALATSYLPAAPGASGQPGPAVFTSDGRVQAAALHLSPAGATVARKLGLAAGELVTLVQVGSADSAAGSPRCLTIAALRPDLFRIAVESAGPPVADLARSPDWQQAVADQPA